MNYLETSPDYLFLKLRCLFLKRHWVVTQPWWADKEKEKEKDKGRDAATWGARDSQPPSASSARTSVCARPIPTTSVRGVRSAKDVN